MFYYYWLLLWAVSRLFATCLGGWPADQLLSVVVFVVAFVGLFLQAWRKYWRNTVFFSDSSHDSSDAETCHWGRSEALRRGCSNSTCNLCLLSVCLCVLVERLCCDSVHLWLSICPCLSSFLFYSYYPLP